MTNKGYLLGGNRYLGYTTTYNFQNYKDLYEYNVTSNTWSLVDNNDKFEMSSGPTSVANGKFFCFNSSGAGAVTVYDLASKLFSQTNGPAFSLSKVREIESFSIGNDVYAWINQDQSLIMMRKLDFANNTWASLKEVAFGEVNNTFIFHFSFAHKGKGYCGVSFINGKAIIMWSFDPVSNEFQQLGTVNIEGAVSFGSLVLRHLFTINDLSYFVEEGESSVGPTSATVSPARDILYIFNHKLKTWKTQSHVLPEKFYSITSFSVNNRGFAGLSVSAASPTFVYSNKFYEFSPK